MRIQDREVGTHTQCDSAERSKLTRSAHEFEAQMMKELLQPICRSEDGEESGSGGALAGFASEALGEAISGAGGFGIASRIVTEVSGNGTVLCR